MIDIILTPGSMGLALTLIGFFGDSVIVGGWQQPCGVRNATDGDIEALRGLLEEFDVTIEEKVGGW